MAAFLSWPDGHRWNALAALTFAVSLLLTRPCPAALKTDGTAPAPACCAHCCPSAQDAKTSHSAPAAPPMGYCCAASVPMLAEGLPTLKVRQFADSRPGPTDAGSGGFAVFTDPISVWCDLGPAVQMRDPFARHSCLRVLLMRCHPGNAPPGGFRAAV